MDKYCFVKFHSSSSMLMMTSLFTQARVFQKLNKLMQGSMAKALMVHDQENIFTPECC